MRTLPPVPSKVISTFTPMPLDSARSSASVSASLACAARPDLPAPAVRGHGVALTVVVVFLAFILPNGDI